METHMHHPYRIGAPRIAIGGGSARAPYQFKLPLRVVEDWGQWQRGTDTYWRNYRRALNVKTCSDNTADNRSGTCSRTLDLFDGELNE